MKNLTKKLTAALLGVILALVLGEIACQVLWQVLVAPGLKHRQTHQNHYYLPHEDARLSYRMRPDFKLQVEERRLSVNKHGFREDSDRTDFPATIAFFGDSVPFGQGVSQDSMPTALLQERVGDDIKVLNFGTCGYGMEELYAYLEINFDIYKPQLLYYFLNLNDFSRRNTIYEGGDNGLYRIYHTPFFKLPFFVRKAIYRYVKDGKQSSEEWYRWMYEGNKDRLLPIVPKMAKFAQERGSEFKVLLFPPAVAYENGEFVVQDVFDEITAYLEKEGLEVIAPIEEYSKDVYVLQDDTDHFEIPGSIVMADFIWKDLQTSNSDLVKKILTYLPVEELTEIETGN